MIEIAWIDYPFDWQEWLLIAFILTVVIQLVQYLVFFGRLAFYKPKYSYVTDEPVSIIICAKDELRNLTENLPLILAQEYPAGFEVVVVNDCSEDATAQYLNDLTAHYPNLKPVNLIKTITFFHGKKFPLSLGIKSARNEWLLFTDADCRPTGKDWLSSMQRNFTDDASFVLGYGKYEHQPGLLNKLIRFDTFYIAIQYMSYALSGKPYMGVGRNMAYRRSIFINNKGFTSHYSVQSGDDDIFVNQHANQHNTKVEFSIESHTISAPKESFAAWMRQKKRHLTSGKYYKTSNKLMLTFFQLNQTAYFGLFIALLALVFNMPIVLGLFTLRLIVQLIVFKKCANRLGEKDLLLTSPLMELFFVFYNPFVYISNIIRKPYRWK